MRMRLPWFAIALLLSLSLAVSHAQQPAGPPSDGGTTEILQSIYIPPLAHAPFSLTLHTEWERPIADGDFITVTNRRLIARDAQGRIFQERRLLVPPHGDAQTPLTLLQYADPVTHTLYNCAPERKVCHLYVWDDHATSGPGIEDSSTVFPGGVTKREDLGRVMREGVEVHGAHIVTTFEPGVIGNKKPVVIEREFLYSDALGINLVSIRNDPRSGKQTFIASDVSRDVPDPSLFVPPGDYTIIDERSPAAKQP